MAAAKLDVVRLFGLSAIDGIDLPATLLENAASCPETNWKKSMPSMAMV